MTLFILERQTYRKREKEQGLPSGHYSADTLGGAGPVQGQEAGTVSQPSQCGQNPKDL